MMQKQRFDETNPAQDFQNIVGAVLVAALFLSLAMIR